MVKQLIKTICIVAFAFSNISAFAAFSGGDGTATSPYLIVAKQI